MVDAESHSYQPAMVRSLVHDKEAAGVRAWVRARLVMLAGRDLGAIARVLVTTRRFRRNLRSCSKNRAKRSKQR